jgi:hypothetical protein
VLKKIYIGIGAVLICGYLGWTLMGKEWITSKRDPLPTVKAGQTGTGTSRSRWFYFGSGGGFGK